MCDVRAAQEKGMIADGTATESKLVGRNWKWFVPVGCLGLLTISIGFVSLIFFLVFSVMKSSDVYKEAISIAEAHPTVQEVIGTPLEEGTFVAGNLNTSGASGEADLAIPISGPNGKGTLYAVAEKSAGQWTFSTLVVEKKETGQRIDLLSNQRGET